MEGTILRDESRAPWQNPTHTNFLQFDDRVLTIGLEMSTTLKPMKTMLRSLIILMAFATLASAADSADRLWNEMFQVMYFVPRMDKAAQLERLKSLIKDGADVNEPLLHDRMARVGETRADLRGTGWPLDAAIQHARLDMVRVLLDSGAKFHGGDLAKAAQAGSSDESLALVTTLLKAGADPNSRHEGFTALLWASYRGNKESVKLLLKAPRIQLDWPSPDGLTALMTAAELGHAEIVEMLLAAGADANLSDQRGETAVSLAQKTLRKQQRIMERQENLIASLQAREK
jgi:hypothetical protein